MKPVRVVLAGLGVRGNHWADVLNRSSRCEIVAFADPDPTALESAQARFGEHQTFESAEEAIENIPDVGALVLANPPMGRESQVRKAVDYNIPMLIEKPLALDLDNAARLVTIAELAGVPLMVGLNFRYLSVTIETMRLINKRIVGMPEFAHFSYERYRDGNRPDLNKYPLIMDQPMLWEQSIHHFDLMRYIYKQEPVSVQCHTWNPSWSMYKSDANVAAIFTFDGGMIVNYLGTWQSNWQVPHFEWRTECTRGIIVQHEQFGELHYAKHKDVKLTKVELHAHETWISETIGLLDTFVDTVIEKRPLQCSGRDHIMSLAMLEACVVSNQERRKVTIESILPEF